MKETKKVVNKDLAHSVENGEVVLFDCPPMFFSDDDSDDPRKKKPLPKINLPTSYYRDFIGPIRAESSSSFSK